MFTRQLYNADPSKVTKNEDPAVPSYRLADYGYGKEAVRLFQLRKDGPIHSIVEFEVKTHMRLRSHKEYYEADNSDIVGSDVQENQVYVYAQKHGISNPEEFALGLSKFFLNAYEQIMEANVIVEELGWTRVGAPGTQISYTDQAHNHAFIRTANGRRSCEVVRKREDPNPLIICRLFDLRLVKTAQAPFVGYFKGAHFSEGDNTDRILCVKLDARWELNYSANIDFSTHWFQVRDLIIKSFAGDPIEGVTTTSVQLIAYSTSRNVLDAIPEISSVAISLPNFRHFPFDFSKFPPIENKAGVIICYNTDSPLAIGYAQVDRKDLNENGPESKNGHH